MEKKIKISIVAIAAIFVSALVFFVTLKNNSGLDISNWPTYKNEKYELEVKYPENHSVKNITSEITGNDPEIYSWYERTDFILDSVVFKNLKKGEETAFDLKILNTTDQDKIINAGRWQTIKENGVKKVGEFDVYSYAVDSEANNMQVIFHDGKAYVFSYYLPEEEFERIISNIKFTK